jgi:hypothetical protein
MKNIRVLYGLLSLFSLIFGMTIYLLFRDLNNMVLFAWLPKPAFAGTVLIQIKPSILSYILKYNLPDTLWFLSALLFFRCLWFCRIKIQKTYIFCFYVFAAVFETSQLSKKVPGTFDLLDLLFMGICAFIEGLLYNTSTKRRLA